MQTRQLQSEHLIFKSPQGERKPGVRPTKYKVLILPDEVNDLTEGGIALPGQSAERAENGQTEGEFIAAGGKAFNDWDNEEIPRKGQRVVFERYAGQFLIGEDGFEYRLMNDDQIVGIRE